MAYSIKKPKVVLTNIKKRGFLGEGRYLTKEEVEKLIPKVQSLGNRLLGIEANYKII